MRNTLGMNDNQKYLYFEHTNIQRLFYFYKNLSSLNIYVLLLVRIDNILEMISYSKIKPYFLSSLLVLQN